MYLFDILRPGDIPDIAALLPGIRHLDLIAVHNLLTEQPVFITNAAAKRRQFQIRQRVQKTSRKSAKAAVSEAGVGLILLHLGEGNAHLSQNLTVCVRLAQIHQVVAHGSAHQKLEGEIIKLLLCLFFGLFFIINPFIHDFITDGHRNRGINLTLGGLIDRFSEIPLYLADNFILDKLFLCVISGRFLLSFQIESPPKKTSFQNPLRYMPILSQNRTFIKPLFAQKTESKGDIFLYY